MTENQIAGLVLVILGALQAFMPDLLLRFQVWVQRVLMRARYEPSDFTRRVVRSLGVGLLILGLLVFTGAVE